MTTWGLREAATEAAELLGGQKENATRFTPIEHGAARTMSKAAMGDMRPTDHGVVLQWRDITYSVTKKKKDGTLDTRVILDNLSGDTSGGSLLALMGPSGSGKTSLLNALAFRVPKGPGAMIGGAIYADGKLVETPSKMARMSAYVEQEDALFALSTVRETLMFAAQLRLPKELVPGVIYGTVIYYMTALREGVKHYLVFLSVMTLENFAGIGLGMCLSASFTSVEMAPQLAPAFVILFLMFSGFFLNESNVPVWLIWLREISFIRYAFQALCVNEFKGAEFSCDGSTGSCVDGDEHLERLKFDDITISGNCGILAGMILGFNLLALGIVYYRQPKYLALEKKTQ